VRAYEATSQPSLVLRDYLPAFTVGLPKKAKDFLSHVHAVSALEVVSRQDSVQSVVENRIREVVCPAAELSEYRSGTWGDYDSVDPSTSTITHEFTCDGGKEKFLFRLRNGEFTEILNLQWFPLRLSIRSTGQQPASVRSDLGSQGREGGDADVRGGKCPVRLTVGDRNAAPP
jgi:hypothetical protein